MKTAGRKRGRPPECPACRGQRTVAIIYGMPSGKIFEAVDRGEIPGAAIGGCDAEPDSPRWVCPDCEHRW